MHFCRPHLSLCGSMSPLTADCRLDCMRCILLRPVKRHGGIFCHVFLSSVGVHPNHGLSSEVSGPQSRFDMVWTIAQGGGEKKLAIIEFKNTKTIHWEDFEPAEVSQANAAEFGKVGRRNGKY